MARLLIVHHTTSPSMQAMFEAVLAGAGTDEIEVLEADGYLLGTSANIGYMSGALKHFFDGIYYPCLAATVRRPYGLYVHGNNSTTGGGRGVDSIAAGLQGRRARPPVSVIGNPGPAALEACWELGATIAAELAR